MFYAQSNATRSPNSARFSVENSNEIVGYHSFVVGSWLWWLFVRLCMCHDLWLISVSHAIFAWRAPNILLLLHFSFYEISKFGRKMSSKFTFFVRTIGVFFRSIPLSKRSRHSHTRHLSMNLMKEKKKTIADTREMCRGTVFFSRSEQNKRMKIPTKFDSDVSCAR